MGSASPEGAAMAMGDLMLPRKFKETLRQPEAALVGEARLTKEIFKKENALRILDNPEFSDLIINLLSTTAEGQEEVEDPDIIKTKMTGGTLELGRKVSDYRKDPTSVEFTDEDVDLLMKYMSMPILNTLQYKMFLYRTNKIAPHLIKTFDHYFGDVIDLER